MVDNSTDCAMVYNGEIYNFLEFREELVKQGIKLQGNSDSEILFHLLQRDGLEILTKLRGIFAFAFYRPDTNTILLGRDALGVKPLYFKSDDVVFGQN